MGWAVGWAGVGLCRLGEDSEDGGEGEARIQRKEEIRRAIGRRMARTPNPWLDMRLQYGGNKGKYFTEESRPLHGGAPEPCWFS